jgi:hypothetical protein
MSYHAAPPREPIGDWFKCKGCGNPAAVFSEGVPGKLPAGAVCHSKPVCGLYRMLDARSYARVHHDAERVTPAVAVDLLEK